MGIRYLLCRSKSSTELMLSVSNATLNKASLSFFIFSPIRYKFGFPLIGENSARSGGIKFIPYGMTSFKISPNIQHSQWDRWDCLYRTCCTDQQQVYQFTTRSSPSTRKGVTVLEMTLTKLQRRKICIV